MDKITYNTIIATVLFLCIVQNAASQRRCIVVSADTRLPVRDVSIRWDNNEVVKSGIAAVDRQLIANTPSGGANLLGLLELVAQPFINKIQRNKELKKARRKQILDNY